MLVSQDKPSNITKIVLGNCLRYGWAPQGPQNGVAWRCDQGGAMPILGQHPSTELRQYPGLTAIRHHGGLLPPSGYPSNFGRKPQRCNLAAIYFCCCSELIAGEFFYAACHAGTPTMSQQKMTCFCKAEVNWGKYNTECCCWGKGWEGSVGHLLLWIKWQLAVISRDMRLGCWLLLEQGSCRLYTFGVIMFHGHIPVIVDADYFAPKFVGFGWLNTLVDLVEFLICLEQWLSIMTFFVMPMRRKTHIIVLIIYV